MNGNMANGVVFLFGVMKICPFLNWVLELDHDNGCTTQNIPKSTELYTLKCEFYVNYISMKNEWGIIF